MVAITVKNASEFSAALNAARGGDTIRLAGGDYGDVLITGKAFANGVTITSANVDDPASFHSINVANSSGLNFVGVNIDFEPTAQMYAWSPALKISGSADISFVDGKIEGGPAINGVSPNAPVGTSDATGNVQGAFTGYGVWLYQSQGVRIEGTEISHLGKGIVLADVSDLTIINNEIHHMRMGMISGGDVSNAVIDGNVIYSSNPHNFSAAGDHADFIHLWTDPARQGEASQNIKITNNLIKQGDGQAVLGIYLDDNGNKLGFKNVLIDGNTILNGNFQGIRLESVWDSKVSNNILLQTTGNAQEAPSLLLRDASHDVQILNNILNAISDLSGSEGDRANTILNNTLVQKANSALIGYYTDTFVTQINDALDLGIGRNLVLKHILGESEPAAAKPDPSAPLPHPAVDQPTAGTSDETKHDSIDGAHLIGAAPGGKLYGTAGNDTLVGRNGADEISGGDGSDIIYGQSGDDKLLGGLGNDTLSGDAGADQMSGGLGDDLYYVENALDVVTEAWGAGHDAVGAYIDYRLPANVEDLRLAGLATYGAGNELANRITSGDLDTKLEGMEGADTLVGRGGNDQLFGGDGADQITGGSGADTIVGGAGADLLTGGIGADRFVFSSADFGTTDTITDFTRAQGDKIDLSAIDANAGTVTDEAFTLIGHAAFSGHAGEVRIVAGVGSSTVMADVNGDKIADLSFKIIGSFSLIDSDFIL